MKPEGEGSCVCVCDMPMGTGGRAFVGQSLCCGTSLRLSLGTPPPTFVPSTRFILYFHSAIAVRAPQGGTPYYPRWSGTSFAARNGRRQRGLQRAPRKMKGVPELPLLSAAVATAMLLLGTMQVFMGSDGSGDVGISSPVVGISSPVVGRTLVTVPGADRTSTVRGGGQLMSATGSRGQATVATSPATSVLVPGQPVGRALEKARCYVNMGRPCQTVYEASAGALLEQGSKDGYFEVLANELDWDAQGFVVRYEKRRAIYNPGVVFHGDQLWLVTRLEGKNTTYQQCPDTSLTRSRRCPHPAFRMISHVLRVPLRADPATGRLVPR